MSSSNFVDRHDCCSGRRRIIVDRRDSRRIRSQFRCHHVVARSLLVAASPGAFDAFFIVDHHCFIICKLGSCRPSSHTIVYLHTVHQHLEPTHVFSIVTHYLNIPTCPWQTPSSNPSPNSHHLMITSFICHPQRRCCGALVGCLSRGTASVPRSLKMIGRYAYSTLTYSFKKYTCNERLGPRPPPPLNAPMADSDLPMHPVERGYLVLVFVMR